MVLCGFDRWVILNFESRTRFDRSEVLTFTAFIAQFEANFTLLVLLFFFPFSSSSFIYFFIFFIFEKLDEGFLIFFFFFFNSLLCDSVWNFPYINISYLYCCFFIDFKQTVVLFFFNSRIFCFSICVCQTIWMNGSWKWAPSYWILFNNIS